MTNFEFENAMLYMKLLSEYNNCKNKKRKAELAKKLEALRNGMRPITL